MTEITISRLSPHLIQPRELTQLNALLKQFSPKAAPLTMVDLRTMVQQNFLFVARNEGKNNIVGMTMLAYYHKPTGRVGIIEDVIVDQAYRRQGIGRALVQRAIDTGRRCGLKHIELTSNPSRVEARALYTSLGFKERDTGCFRLEL
ncbi:GNAT family N-acetyltransferase [Candidatus Kaiserbacteria bacterium]|nr:GNAT family N-acetyltransferase [Candidatus Kaiserbacteria bacterium]